VSQPPESLTVLRAQRRRLAKRIRPDGVDGYDRAKHLEAFTVKVADLNGTHDLLQRLLPRPECCVIRGALIAGTQAKGIRRLLHVDKQTGELPTFRDVPRRWLALDVEGLPLPADTLAADLARCAAAALAGLPTPFWSAAHIVQASSSHGFKPDMRLRMWFWLSRPVWGFELKRWLKGAPVDHSVFGTVQPIYTAAPVLAPGVNDPIPARALTLPGEPIVIAPSPEELAPPPPPIPSAPPENILPSRAHAYVRKALERGAERIANSIHPGRHPMIVAETTRLARFVDAGLLTSGDVTRVVRAAAEHAGKDDKDEVDAAIAWGLANPWKAGPLPGERRHG
jgi:hypothetical protein